MTPWVLRLVVLNVVMFFLQKTVPSLTSQLELIPPLVLARPWTTVTYMFLHAGIGHIFFNMLGLYIFGPRVEERVGSQRFFALYMISGISGALLSLALRPENSVIGASGAIYGVMLAFAYFWPRVQFYIWGIVPVEARWLVLGYTLLNLAGAWEPGSMEAHFAHLGGFAGAFLYLRFMERTQGAKRFRRTATAPPKERDTMLGNWRAVNRADVHDVNREEVDRILDKISASGLSSLTPQERLFLSNFVPPDDRKQ